MKRIARMTAALALVVGLMAPSAAAAAEPPIQVLLQGAPVQFDAEPFIENNRTLVPLRALSERLGFKVDWLESEQRITLTKDGKTVVLWVGKLDAQVDGKPFTLEVAPKIQGNRTFVPVRFISEQLGANVFWDGEKRHIRVTPSGASDPDALAWLTASPATQNEKMLIKGDFALQMTSPGETPVNMKGQLNFHAVGQEMLGQMDLFMVMQGVDLPAAKLEMAVRNGFMWMKMGGGMFGSSAPASWQEIGPIGELGAKTPGSPAAQLPGAGLGSLSPADLAKLTATIKDQVSITFGSSEVRDGKKLVRLDVDMSRIDFTKLLSTMLGGELGDLPTATEMPKINAKLSILAEEATKIVRGATLDATMSGNDGEQLVMKFNISADPTQQAITWPADLPTAPATNTKP